MEGRIKHPYVKKEIIGNCTLYLGDCFEILPTLNNIDVIITDPPYIVSAGAGGGAFGNRNHLVKTGGFTDKGVDYSFLSYSKNWMCFCSLKQIYELIGIAKNNNHWNLITWAKPNPVPTCNNKYLPDSEYIIHSYANNNLFGEYKDKQSFFLENRKGKETEHPNEKPLNLIKKLINLSCQKDNNVCDPFMGSGTTGVIANKLGFNFIGIEKDINWFTISCERIANASLIPYKYSNNSGLIEGYK
jgi:DNA modification methylase